MPYADTIKQKEYQREYHARRWQVNLEENRKAAREKAKLLRDADPEKAREDVRKWRKNNPEKAAECNRNWHKENKEKIKKWRDANPDKMKATYKRSYKKHREKKLAYSKKWQAKNPHRFWAINTISRHKKGGYDVDATIDEIMNMAKNANACPYCGVTLEFANGKGMKRGSPSLDRINNGKVINKNNVQIICHSCNTTKLNRTHVEFIEYCKKIIHRFEE